MPDTAPLPPTGGTMTLSGQTDPGAVFISDGVGGLTIAWSGGIITTWTWDDTPGAKGYYNGTHDHTSGTSKIVWECTLQDTDGHCTKWSWNTYTRGQPSGPWAPDEGGTAKTV